MALQIEPKNWKLRQYRDFIRATKEGNLDKVIELVPMLIVKWDFSGDPHDLDYVLDTLSLQDWIELSQAVGTALEAEFASPKK